MINSQIDQQTLRIKAALISILIHICLLSIKLLVGISTNSLSIIALAADSGFDIIASFATYWGILKISKPADLDHTYGHGKYEFAVSAFQAIILFITAGFIIYEAFFRLINGAEVEPNYYSFMIMIIGIVANVFLSRYLSDASKKTNSLALEANSINSLSDILNYLIVFVSLFFIYFLKLDIIDGIVAIGISLFIFRGGYKLVKKAFGGLLDKIPEEVKIERIKEISESIPGVIKAHDIRMRTSGPFIFMDLHVNVDSIQSVEYSHLLTEMIEKEVKKEFPSITDVLIHIEPIRVLDNDIKSKVRKSVLEFKEVKRCHHIHFGFLDNKFFLDLHIIINGDLSLDYVHSISNRIEEKLKNELKNELDNDDIDILIHAEPYNNKDRKELIEDITTIVKNMSVVKSCHNVNIIVEEKEIICTMHVGINKDMNIDKAHEISNIIEKIVEAKLKDEFKEKKSNITIHIEPR